MLALFQKIRAQSSGSGYGTGAYVSPSSSSIGIQQMLQAETMKSQQLLERVREERQHHIKQTHDRDDDHTREMMMMMMSQNMQMQQVMLQQMTSSSAANRLQPAEKASYQTLSTVRPVEIEQVGHREMTPFTSLSRSAQRADLAPPAPKLKQPAPLPRKPSPKPLIARGVATPVRPTERIPEPKPRPQPRSQPLPKPEGFIGQVTRSDPEEPYPFPGPRGARKLRHYGYAAWACFILISLLKKVAQRRVDAMERLNNLINQAIDELHRRHYLEGDGAIYVALQDATQEDALDLKVKNPGVFQRLSQDSQAAISELSSMIETIVYNVIQIKPQDGILSATREGVLWEMTQAGVLFPPDYLWQVEKDNIAFGDRGELAQVNNQSNTMLLLGLFISRGLVSTLLLKPVEHGVMENVPSILASSNLKVLASSLMKIVREVSLLPKKKIMPLASEISSQLYSDEEMKYIYKKIGDSLIWSKANLKRWAEAYVDSLSRN